MTPIPAIIFNGYFLLYLKRHIDGSDVHYEYVTLNSWIVTAEDEEICA